MLNPHEPKLNWPDNCLLDPQFNRNPFSSFQRQNMRTVVQMDTTSSICVHLVHFVQITREYSNAMPAETRKGYTHTRFLMAFLPCSKKQRQWHCARNNGTKSAVSLL
jgi:hypothetical protein